MTNTHETDHGFLLKGAESIDKEAKKLKVSAAKVLRELVDEGLFQREYFTKVVMKSDRQNG